MIWLVLILPMMLAMVRQWWSEEGFRFYVVFSLGANVALGLLSRTRRRSAFGWRAKCQKALVLIVWVLYQLGDTFTTSAISELTLCGSDVSEDEKQLVALWAPFLLLHLGGPDNLTAYALEDNKLSMRKLLEMIGNILGVGYAIYKYTYSGGHSRVLLAASLIIAGTGTTRYLERVYALWKANLDKMQEDTAPDTDESTAGRYRMSKLESAIEKKVGWEVGDREALLLAQDLYPIWRHAMVDSSVTPGSSSQHASEKVLLLKWSSMCKVAEMELSLMYEVLYTKAIVAHTFPGCYYLIRLLGPLFTAAAALLFWFHRQQQQQGRIRGSFVRITYALLVVNFLLDLAWLLRALGSTWAYHYMQADAPAWLYHQVICPGRWRCLHRLVVRIDPMWWLLCRDPISYRTWSGTIGRYNLLDECTSTRSSSSLCTWLEPDEIRFLYELPPCVKELLFKRVQEILLLATGHTTTRSRERYTMEDIRTKWGQKAFDLRDRKLFQRRIDDAPKFGKEFEEDVLIWHIATCIALPFIRQKGGPLGAKSNAHWKAIKVMSEYMMFLVSVRREMLPGLVLHSLFKVTRDTLVDVWKNDKGSQKEKEEAQNNGEILAMVLRRIRRVGEEKWVEIRGTEGTRLLADAVELFVSLTRDAIGLKTKVSKARGQRGPTRETRMPVPELLDFIFNVWVDKLVYAAVRCSRESHAKQLSAGGDLTTVLWMVIQHAGLFRMGERPNIHIKPAEEKKPEQPPPPKAPEPPPKKREEKKPEEKKKMEEKPKPEKSPPPPDEATEDEGEEDSDDEYTKEFNKPIEYLTLY